MSDKQTGIGAKPQARGCRSDRRDRHRHARVRVHGQGPLQRIPQDRLHDMATAAACRGSSRSQAGTKRRSPPPLDAYGYERWTTDWRDIVADPTIGLFDNGGPNSLHAEPTIAAAEAGKHVLCEKPLGRDADESYEIWQRVAATGVKHLCAFNYRFVPAVRLAREMIDAGELGEIRHFRGALPAGLGRRSDARHLALPAGGGRIGRTRRFGAHVVDLARFLVGEISTVSALVRTFLPGRAGRRRHRGGRRVRAWRGRHDRVDEARARPAQCVPVGDQRLERVDRVRHGAAQRASGVPRRRRPRARLQDGSRVRGRPSVLGVLVAARATSSAGARRSCTRSITCCARSPRTSDVAPYGATFEDGYRAAEVCDAIVRSSESGQRETVRYR